MKNLRFKPFRLTKTKELFCKKVMPQLEIKSEMITSKFEVFCNRFFEEQNELINIENFPCKNDSVLEERTYTWEMQDTEFNSEIISGYMKRMFKKISRNFIIFIEFDAVFYNELIISSVSENINFVLPFGLNKNFKLISNTPCISEHKQKHLFQYSSYLSHKKNKFFKKFSGIIKLNIFRKLFKYFLNKIQFQKIIMDNKYSFPKLYRTDRNFKSRFS